MYGTPIRDGKPPNAKTKEWILKVSYFQLKTISGKIVEKYQYRKTGEIFFRN